MTRNFRQSMAWLHTWAGLIFGWLLFAVFVTGTLSCFRTEISLWMRPELRLASPAPEVFDTALSALQHEAPNADSWTIRIPNERDPTLEISWPDPSDPELNHTKYVDPLSGKILRPRETQGGDFFYRFHFELGLPNPWGRWIVGIATMALLTTLISGIVIHRRIFKDFFTFRPGASAQRYSLDAHNALAVFALPFHLMITYSGLVILMYVYMPAGVVAAYGTDFKRFLHDISPNFTEVPAAGVNAPLAPLEAMARNASKQWNGSPLNTLTIHHPGDANAIVEITRADTDRINAGHELIVFDGVTGVPLYRFENRSSATSTRNVLYGLHLGRFADLDLRWLYFLSGLSGGAMIASGLLLWSLRRHANRAGATKGSALVDVLNIGSIAGLINAIAIYFWANRLLPVDLSQRAAWEIGLFFASFALAFIYAALRPPIHAWREELGLAAFFFLMLPFLDGLPISAATGEWPEKAGLTIDGFGLCVFLSSLILAWTSSRIGRLAVRKSLQESSN